MRTLLLLLALVLASCQAPPIVREVHSATEFSLQDGTRYRLAGLQEPTADDGMGETCRMMAAKLLLDRRVKLVAEPADAGAVFAYVPIQVEKKEGAPPRYLFVNAEMVLFGFARAGRRPESSTLGEHYDNLERFEESARARQMGLWATR